MPGDRVFLPISNARAVEMAIAVFAVFRAGGIACPINTRLNPREIADYAALCEPRFCLTAAPDLVKTLALAGCWHVAAMPRDLSAPPAQASRDPDRSDAPRVGKTCVIPCSSSGAPS